MNLFWKRLIGRACKCNISCKITTHTWVHLNTRNFLKRMLRMGLHFLKCHRCKNISCKTRYITSAIKIFMSLYIYKCIFMSLVSLCPWIIFLRGTNNFTRSDLYIWKEFVCVHTFRARNLHLLRHRRITDYLLTRFWLRGGIHFFEY